MQVQAWSGNRNKIPKLFSYENRNNRNKFSYEMPFFSYALVPIPSYGPPPLSAPRPPRRSAAPICCPRLSAPSHPVHRNISPKLPSYNNRNNKMPHSAPIPSASPLSPSWQPGFPDSLRPARRNTNPKLDSYDNRNNKMLHPSLIPSITLAILAADPISAPL